MATTSSPRNLRPRPSCRGAQDVGDDLGETNVPLRPPGSDEISRPLGLGLHRRRTDRVQKDLAPRHDAVGSDGRVQYDAPLDRPPVEGDSVKGYRARGIALAERQS